MNPKSHWKRLYFFGLCLCFLSQGLLSAPERYDVLIKNTKIVDGTGKAAFRGDIAVKGEKIVAVGKIKGEAATIIDGSGLVTCPGFIDPHSHADFTIMQYPLAENLIMQGITTFVGGNCGMSQAPLKDLTFGGWLSKVETEGTAVNMVPLVGHSTIRSLVMGLDFKREATEGELGAMKAHLEEAMKSGAFGISAGEDPPWEGYFASMEEKVELAKVVNKYGGFYSPHTRHERNQWPTDDLEKFSYVLYYGPPEDAWVGRYRGLLEAIEVARKSKIRLHIAHIPQAYLLPLPHPDYLEEAAARATLEIVDKARQEGLQVTCDVILPPRGQTVKFMIDEFLDPQYDYPDWLTKLKKEDLAEKLKAGEFRSRIRKIYDAGRLKFCMTHTKVDPYWMDCFKILRCKNSLYEGKTVTEVANLRNTDALEAVFDILVEDPEAIWVAFLDRRYNQAAVSVLLKYPLCEPCTDDFAAPAQMPADFRMIQSPTTWGCYPYYLSTYVKEKRILSLEEAVRKATSMPAQRIGLKDRGSLSPGAWADVLVFNFETIRMTGDYLKPDQRPDGIEYVLVNGKIVYQKKAHTGLRPGKVLRHETAGL